MKRLGILSALALALTLTMALAQSPANLEITPQAGAWLICATSFTGDNSAKLANELALELRNNHRLNAYVFDRGAAERQKQDEEIRRRRELMPNGRIPRIRIEDQHAVLVGSYRDMDSARRALDDVRKLMPSDKFCLMGERYVRGKSKEGEDGLIYQKIQYGPFTNAFVVPNPTIPTEKPKETSKDLETVMKEVNLPLLRKLNAHETHSLLKNPKNWTLVVATFQSPYENVGAAPGALTKSFNKLLGKEDDKRNASAENACALADTLRDPRLRLGLDSYVLHTSYYSIVTVGGFESGDDPRMRQVQEVIQRLRITGGQTNMLVQPMPMPVPR